MTNAGTPRVAFERFIERSLPQIVVTPLLAASRFLV